jgi:hypothetical protein
MYLKFWTLCILLIAGAHSTDVKDHSKAKDFDNLFNEIKTENALLKEQVTLLKEQGIKVQYLEANIKQINELLEQQLNVLKGRDIESDIEEIKKRLDSYGKDITALRITQGEHTGELNQHNDHLAMIDNSLIVIDQTFVQHSAFMEENRNIIASHTQIINDHQVLIQANTDGINNNAGKIQENQNSIVKNGQDIQSLSDNYNNYRNSQVKFFVETTCCEGSEYWPDYSRLNYRWKHIDTHNALDTGSGQFTTPISGWYGFVLSADFRMSAARPAYAFIAININENAVKKYMYDNRDELEIDQSYSIYFANYLNQGDRVDISVEGDPSFDISRNGATWMGYMI